MMTVAGTKEATIAGRTAIRVLKQHMAQEPIFDAASFRTKELFAATMGTTRDLSLRSGFVHGKSSAGDAYVTTDGRPNSLFICRKRSENSIGPKRRKTQRKAVLHSTDCSLIRERLRGIEHRNRSKTHSNRLTSASE